jgi:hypothetical protein
MHFGFAYMYMKQLLNKTAYHFSVSLILIPFLIILNFLNKKESNVICMREFEIILWYNRKNHDYTRLHWYRRN